MAINELKTLLETYRFVDRAVEEYRSALTSNDLKAMRDERAEVFGKLLSLETELPQVALAQLRVLVEALAGLSRDEEMADRLRGMCHERISTIERLSDRERGRGVTVETGIRSRGGFELDETTGRMLDFVTDRVVIIGTDYKYRFANTANANFHDMTANAFIGQPLWAKTNEKFFAEVSKPTFDRCFAGETASYMSPHPGRETSVVHLCRVDPIRDSRNKVVAAIAIATEISDAPVHMAARP